jgi:hypothetical protein
MIRCGTRLRPSPSDHLAAIWILRDFIFEVISFLLSRNYPIMAAKRALMKTKIFNSILYKNKYLDIINSRNERRYFSARRAILKAYSGTMANLY